MGDQARALLGQKNHEPLPGAAHDSSDEEEESGKKDTVQFSSPFYFADEESDNNFVIHIVRIGQNIGAASVTFETGASSAKEFEHFIPLKKEVHFAANETRQEVTIELLDKDGWDTTREMRLSLSEPQGCTLGPYLRRARLKIIDSDHFPSDNVEEELAHGAASISRTKLLWEYFKLVFSQKDMKIRTIVQVLLDQISNVYLYYTIRLEMYLVNELLVSDDPYLLLSTKEGTVALVSIMFFAPMVLIQIAEEIQTQMNLNSRVKIYLQKALFRKYLNFTAHSRMKVAASTIQSTISDKSIPVANAYTSALDLITTLVRVVMLLYFTHKRHTGALKLILVMPIVLALFGLLRISYLLEAMKKLVRHQGVADQFVAETCNLYDLIHAYSQRPQMGDLFTERTNTLSLEALTVNSIANHNSLFTRWLSPVFIAVYVYLYAKPCINGDLKLGVFLALLGIIKGMSITFASIFSSIVGIYAAVNPLSGITDIINMETELRESKVAYDRRSKMTLARHDQHASTSPVDPQDDTPVLDRLEIELVNVNFEYAKGARILSDVNLRIKQGSLVGILGDPGSGRRTFLQLLAQMIFPSKGGEVFVPLHVITLFVSQSPLLFAASAWFNLTFGSIFIPSPDRVKAILQKIGAPNLASLVADAKNRPTAEEDGPNYSDWLGSLSYTNRMKIHLARAFIMNPTMMILCRPFDIFYRDDEKVLLAALRDHVAGRGLCVGKAGRVRRPRTVVMTLEDIDDSHYMDDVLQVKNGSVTRVHNV